jgi:integrase/recombinase XerD
LITRSADIKDHPRVGDTDSDSMLTMTPNQHSESHLAVTHRWRQYQGMTCCQNTIDQRCDVVELLVEHASAAAGHWVDPRDLDAVDVAAYLSQQHFSANTRATYYRALKAWFGWLHRTGRIASDPIVELGKPKQPDGVPSPLTDVELARVFADIPLALFAMMALALLAGLRASEVASFRGDQIRDGRIFVRGKGGKDAVLPLDPQLAQLAARMPVDWWFPSRTSPRDHVRPERVSVLVGERFRECGIPAGSIHRLRHTYGTKIQKHVGDIRVTQQLMRHSSVATTMRYTAVADDRLAAALDGLPRLTA